MKKGFNILFTKIKKDTGFTFLEFLIYITIVGVILTVTGNLCLNVFFAKAKLTAIEMVNQDARFATEKVSERIRSAEAINNPALGESSTTLSLQMADLAKNPTVFDLSDGTIRIKEGSGAVVDLTTSEVILTTLQFSNISYPNTPGTLRVQMTIKSINPENRLEYNFEKTFYTTENIYKK